MATVVEAELGGGEGGGGIRHGTVDFNNLPEDCIANIISFTTPRDACRLSLLSSIFRSASQSDVVWNRFLPSDFQSEIARYSSSTSLASKKDLYLSLSQNPLLIDGNKKSIQLDKASGKTCYMLSAEAEAAPIDPDHTARENLHPKERADGWLETELGEYFNGGGEDEELEMGVYEVKRLNWKGGLFVR